HRRSLRLRREVGDTNGVVKSLLTGARAMTMLDRPERALEMLDEAESIIPGGSLSALQSILWQRIDVYQHQGDFESAFRTQERLILLSDAQAKEDLAARVEQLQQAFRAEQLERELALQRARTEVSEQRARRQQLISTASIILVVLLLLILGLVYNRYRLGRRVSHALDR